MSGMANWKAKIELDIKDLQKQLIDADEKIDKFANENRKVKLDIDTKTLESAIQKLDKMLDSLGKGTGDFKQFENLSKELSSIVSEIQSLSKAFGKVDDSGTKTLLSSIQNIDKSLTELSQNILNVNKNMSNMGGNTSGAVKQVENISNAYQDAAKEAEKLADAQSKIGQESNISSDNKTTLDAKKELKEYSEGLNYTNEQLDKLNGLDEKLFDSIAKGEISAREALNKIQVELQELGNKAESTSDKISNIFVHFGTDFDNSKFEKIKNRIDGLNKPGKGFWGSYLDSEYGWEQLFEDPKKYLTSTYFESNDSKEWFASNEPNKILQSFYKLKEDAHVLVLETVEDLQQLPSRGLNSAGKALIDWEKIAEQYDAISVKISNSTNEFRQAMYGWDADSLVVTNPNAIIQVDAPDYKAKEIEIAKQIDLYKQLKKEASMPMPIAIQSEDISLYNSYKNIVKSTEKELKLGTIDANTALEKQQEILKGTVFYNDKWNKLNPTKDAFPDKDVSVSVESATNSIKEENNVLEQNTQKVKENTQAKEQNVNANLNKYDKRLDSYNGKVDKYQATIDRFNDGGWTSNTYLENVQAVKNAVHEYETLLNELKVKDASLVTSEDISNLDNYEKKIKDTIATVTNMSAAEKGYDAVSGQKELDKIHKILNENSKMSSRAKAQIKAFYKEIESGNPSMSLNKIHAEIMKIYNAEVEAGRAGRSFFDTLKNSGFHQIAAQMAGMVGVYDVINLGKEAVSTIVKLDTALVDLKKTTSMSSSQLENFYYDSNNVAKQMGVTTEEIINQASAWSRLGYSSQEAATTMAKLSSQFASISPGMDTDTAQQGLVSIMKAWDIDYTDVKSEIMDNINALGNGMAEDNQDIVEGMERSAAALAAVGTSYEDAFAMFSGIQEVLQNAEKSGTALRSLAMRVRGYDESTEELSDDLKNVTGDLINLTKTAEHTQGVSIFKDGSTTEFKDLTTYFGEIASIWDEMTQKQQNDYLQKAFGKNQAQAGAALIQNYKGVTKALDIMTDAAGSSDREMETIESSLEYKINALKETWVGTVQDIIDRGDVGTIVDGLTKVSEAIGFITGKLGLLGSTGTVLSGVLGAKGLGLT